MEVLYGLHPVSEALKAGRRRFDHVLVARERRDDRLEAIVHLCKDLKIRLRTEPREVLNDIARTPHLRRDPSVPAAVEILCGRLLGLPAGPRGTPLHPPR